MKRVKLKKEDPSINFRLPQELREKVLQKAAIENKTVSNYLRDHLESFLSGKLIEDAIAPYVRHKFINSNEFLQLVVWMYQKKENPRISDYDKLIQKEYIETLKKVSQYLPKDLADEFEKVLYDVIYSIQENRYSYKIFNSDYSSINFDFEKLENYINNLGNKVHKVRF